MEEIVPCPRNQHGGVQRFVYLETANVFKWNAFISLTTECKLAAGEFIIVSNQLLPG